MGDPRTNRVVKQIGTWLILGIVFVGGLGKRRNVPEGPFTQSTLCINFKRLLPIVRSGVSLFSFFFQKRILVSNFTFDSENSTGD